MRSIPLRIATACLAVSVCACGSSVPSEVPTSSPEPSPTMAPTPTVTVPPSPVPTTVLTAPPPPFPSPTALAPAGTVTSDDGLLTVDVSAGALPAEVSLTATARGSDELPAELHGLEVRSAFYELAPENVEFASPVTVTRRVNVHDLGLVEADGLPVLVLAMRSNDGEWQWLADQTLSLAGEDVVVSGQATETGLVFAFGGKNFTRHEASTTEPVLVGSSLKLTATLSFPDEALDPPVLGSFEPILETDIATLGPADGPSNDTLSQEFVCATGGSAVVGVRYGVLNIGADSVLFDQLGLGPIATQVTATTPLECLDESAAPPSAPS